jgi:secondary thiamine-phosphate synthase enzyme
MKSIVKRFTIVTHHETELINITERVLEEVKASGVRSGTAFVLSLHTTTGLTVNEGLPDLEQDIADCLRQLVPEEGRTWKHARFLHEDGQMAINAPSHLRGALLGFEVFFPIENGEVVKGTRQTIYFVELDGPQERTWVLQVLGE